MTITIIHRELIPSTLFGPIRLVFFGGVLVLAGLCSWRLMYFQGYFEPRVLVCKIVKACAKVLEERGSREGFYHLKDNASILKKFHCFIKN